MTLTETSQLLYLFSEYWPTFQIKPQSGDFPGTAAIWFQALEPYSMDSVRRALMKFRGESERTWAPTLSELEGSLREYEKESDNADRARKLLGTTRVDPSAPHTETYFVNQIVGQNKDGTPIMKAMPYIRATREVREREIRERVARGAVIERSITPGGKFNHLDFVGGYPEPAPKRERVKVHNRPAPDETHDWETVINNLSAMREMPKRDHTPPMQPEPIAEEPPNSREPGEPQQTPVESYVEPPEEISGF